MNAPAASILVVDDEPDLRTLYELTLLREGYRVETAASVQEAREQLKAQRFDAVITDMRLPDGFGMELLQDLREQQRKERCVVMTAYGSAENAVEALRSGAFDYLTKPVDLKQFRSVVASAIQGTGGVPAPRAARTPGGRAGGGGGAVDAQASSSALDRLVGESAAMRNVKQRVAKVARGMAPVLIHGESGTGKELVAQALHASSQRADGPWVAVNCGAIPENLLEAEFFGARKGSYTGASQDRDGYFQAARGGTLFLDEIGDLPLAMQSKLLRTLQEGTLVRLGGQREVKVNVRLVAATNRDLAREVEAGRFRQDLYYRLNVIPIRLPSLAERREDIRPLALHFVSRANQAHQRNVNLAPDALARLEAQPWPGNIRELGNVIERLVLLAEDTLVTGEELDRFLPNVAAASPPPAAAAPQPLTELPLVRDYAPAHSHSAQALQAALADHHGNQSRAAQSLGLTLRQFSYRLRKAGLR